MLNCYNFIFDIISSLNGIEWIFLVFTLRKIKRKTLKELEFTAHVDISNNLSDFKCTAEAYKKPERNNNQNNKQRHGVHADAKTRLRISRNDTHFNIDVA